MPDPLPRAVLNVDDHEMVRYLRSRILRQAGFEVTEAANGYEALRLVASGHPHLVVLDVGLPDIHGFEVCQRIKADPGTASIPVLEVSATFRDTETAARSLESGADAYLSEPVAPEILVATVKSLLRARQAEQAVREAAWHWQATFDAIQDGVALLDARGDVIRCNAALARLLGRTAEEIIGRPCREVIPVAPGAIWEAPVNRVLETRRHESGSVPLGPRWYRLTADPVLDPAGGVTGAVWILSDITERRLAGIELEQRARRQEQAEEALRQSEARLQAILNNTPDVVFLKDLDGRYLYVNRPWGEGLSKQELIGKTDYDWFSASFAGVYRAHDQQVLAHSRALQFEEEVPEDDAVKTYLVTRFPICDPNGAPRALGGVATDITDRKATEQERAQLLAREQSARAESDAANRAKDEFLATVSHELRTPLTAIMGWSRMLRTRHLSPEQTREAIEVIERNARTQARLIEDLLDTSRIIAGNLRLNLREVDLNAVLEAGLELVRPTAEAKRQSLECRREAPVCTVRGDPERLQQVIVNLVCNSVKFTPEGGRIDVRLAVASGFARLAVRDEGVGISEDLLPYIFDPFRQGAGAVTGRQSGVGLGLAIVRRLVELHGGSVRAESRGTGLGAAFLVELPLCETEGLTGAGGGSTQSEEISLSGIRLLLVEDELDHRRFVTLALEQYGAEVRTAESALDALMILQQWTPDVLISDLGMPLENGLSLIAHVRRLPRCQHLPGLALTAHAREQDRIRALDAGFAAYLSKPVDVTELAGEVARLARRR